MHARTLLAIVDSLATGPAHSIILSRQHYMNEHVTYLFS